MGKLVEEKEDMYKKKKQGEEEEEVVDRKRMNWQRSPQLAKEKRINKLREPEKHTAFYLFNLFYSLLYPIKKVLLLGILFVLFFIGDSFFGFCGSMHFY